MQPRRADRAGALDVRITMTEIQQDLQYGVDAGPQAAAGSGVARPPIR